MALKVKADMSLASDLIRNEQTLIAQLAAAKEREKASLIQQMKDLAGRIKQLLEEAVTISAELGRLSERAQLEGDRVYSYVHAAYQEANSAIVDFQSQVPAFQGDPTALNEIIPSDTEPTDQQQPDKPQETDAPSTDASPGEPGTPAADPTSDPDSSSNPVPESAPPPSPEPEPAPAAAPVPSDATPASQETHETISNLNDPQSEVTQP